MAPCQIVKLADPASEAAATAWWENLTEAGGEGAGDFSLRSDTLLLPPVGRRAP